MWWDIKIADYDHFHSGSFHPEALRPAYTISHVPTGTSIFIHWHAQSPSRRITTHLAAVQCYCWVEGRVSALCLDCQQWETIWLLSHEYHYKLQVGIHSFPLGAAVHDLQWQMGTSWWEYANITSQLRWFVAKCNTSYVCTVRIMWLLPQYNLPSSV